MADPIPADVREAAVAAYLAKEGTVEALSKRYGISSGSLYRFVGRHRHQQGWAPEGPRRGRPPTYDADEMEVLRQYTVEHPQASTTELRQFMKQHTGKAVGRNAMDNYLRMLGIRRRRPPEAAPTAPALPPSLETRYQKRHRRHESGTYPTDLTDHEWALLEPHFAPSGRGRPPEHAPRTLLNAILYVLRTGCAWWMLPHDFPPYKSVYTAFRRWIRNGRLREAHDALRREFRRRKGRNEDPSAIIVDSQTVKTTEKGGLEATMQARKPKGGSVTSRWTPRES
jgi:transposase